MNSNVGVTLRWPAIVAAAILLMALGAIGSFLITRTGVVLSPGAPAVRTSTPPMPRDQAPTASAHVHPRPPDDGSLPDIAITIGDRALEGAGLVLGVAESAPAAGTLRLPAVVEPNAYALVNVTSLVAGRVTKVLAELGSHVRPGQAMATLFSPELADAQTRYIAACAELDAHERALARSEKLVQIGAASQQELERLHAEHTAQRTNVESLRSRLELLGLSRAVIQGLAAGAPLDTNIDIPAPISGVVTERLANVGLNVDTETKLFTVVDLSTVWIVANLYEKDFARLHVGDRASVVTTAYPDLRLGGRVGYLDPQVNPESRTAKVRVEVPNPRQALRLGMLAEMLIEGANETPVTVIPRSAVQNIADRSFVYLAMSGAPTQFIEREVHLGQTYADHVEVSSGLVSGDRIVTEGSFFLRAERERLGLRPSGSHEFR